MKLTIDTQVDTHEDIRKVLQVLTSILDKKDTSLPSSSSATTDTTDLMSMFSDDSQKGTVETKGSPPDFSSFLSLTQKKDGRNNDDEGKIEYY